MINAKHKGLVALFIVTGFCLSSLGRSATVHAAEHLSIPGLTFDVSSPALPHIPYSPLTSFASTPSAVVKLTKPAPSLFDLFVSPAPALFPLESAIFPTRISMVTQEITEGTVTPTPTIAPTATPSPTPRTSLIAPQAPSPSITTSPNLSSGGGLNADTLFQIVQDYRAKIGLPAFQKNDQTCSLAASRAPEIGAEIAEGHMHSGLKARNLPYWNTENIISMRSETEAFNWWINDYIHKVAIESHNTYSCMACNGNSCVEEFTSLEAK